MQTPDSTTSILQDWEGIIFDLDGTLVRLVVPWQVVDAEIATLFRDRGRQLPEDEELWSFLHIAEEDGFRSEVEDILQAYEIDGAEASRALPLLDYLWRIDQPIAVCSLNCETACRIALETHDSLEAVEGVIGRDSVSTWKPSPEPLEAAIDTINATVDESVFIGDSYRDEKTANAAGVEFRYVKDIVG